MCIIYSNTSFDLEQDKIHSELNKIIKMSNIDTPLSLNAKKMTTAPNTSSPKLQSINTPPNSTQSKRIDKTPLSSSLSSSPVSAISSYLKHLLGINAKTTKRSINEGKSLLIHLVLIHCFFSFKFKKIFYLRKILTFCTKKIFS